ncbi:hypothetical protein LR48_Vigan01g200900 [Vigna angularis]|uniref:GH16 domain-containing protein n=1 Tax=Phaseolus angularis TaxID=3914 RepID=A0A0L9TPH3_PHAAN|nr:hypothetical protein LR48_Vigan01g200900 [Vigna angularis]
MATFYHVRNASVLFLWVLVSAGCVWGRPATFLQDFRVSWGDSHITRIDQGRAIQLRLDKTSGTTIYIILFRGLNNPTNFTHVNYL